MGGSQGLIDVAKTKLTNFFIKFGGNTNRVKDLSIQDLKAIIVQDLSVIVKLQDPKGKSDYNRERFHNYRKTYQIPIASKIIEIAAALGLFTLAAGTASQLMKSDKEKNEETKKDIQEKVNSVEGSFNTCVKERKEAEKELSNAKKLLSFYRNFANSEKISSLEFLHMIEKFDNDFPIEVPSEVQKQLREIHSEVLPLIDKAEKDLETLNSLYKIFEERLKQKPQLIQEYVDKVIKNEFKMENKATHRMRFETTEFKDEKKIWEDKLREQFEGISNLKKVIDRDDVISRYKSKSIASEYHTFAFEFKVKSDVIEVGRREYAKLKAGSKSSGEELSIDREEVSHLKELTASCSRIKLLDNTDPKFKEEADEIQKIKKNNDFLSPTDSDSLFSSQDA
jgi:hypothetical protein